MNARDAVTVFAKGVNVLQGKRTLREARGISDEAINSMYAITYELYNNGKYGEALKSFELLCLYDHENPKYWMGLGYCRQMLEDYIGAATALSYSTVHLDDHDWELYLNIAQCLIASGQQDSAKEYLSEILASDSDQVLKNKAQTLQDQCTKTS